MLHIQFTWMHANYICIESNTDEIVASIHDYAWYTFQFFYCFGTMTINQTKCCSWSNSFSTSSFIIWWMSYYSPHFQSHFFSVLLLVFIKWIQFNACCILIYVFSKKEPFARGLFWAWFVIVDMPRFLCLVWCVKCTNHFMRTHNQTRKKWCVFVFSPCC